MATLLADRVLDNTPTVFNLPTFRRAMVANNAHIANQNEVATFSVEPTTALRYTGDFFGLLSHMKVPDQYHYFIAYINGIEDPLMYDGLKNQVLMVDNPQMDEFATGFRTTSR